LSIPLGRVPESDRGRSQRALTLQSNKGDAF
jgi:hypothetical protein